MKTRFAAIVAIVLILAGCNKDVSIKFRERDTLPKPKVTRTVTETVLVERVVPVTRVDRQISTSTQTMTSTGAAAAPLHDTKLTNAGAGPIPAPADGTK